MIYETLWLYFSFDHKNGFLKHELCLNVITLWPIVSHNLGTQQSLEELILKKKDEYHVRLWFAQKIVVFFSS